ncbi:MAG: CHASE2 domain-containing protein [Desulfobacterales bacterium]|nr:CHASE2 domain-containing protein [Desulfobacterales bacterium]
MVVLDIFLDTVAERTEDDDALVKTMLETRQSGVPVVAACRLVSWGRFQLPLLPSARYLETGAVSAGHAHVIASSVDGVIRSAQLATPVLDEKGVARLDRAGMADRLRYFDFDGRQPGSGRFFFRSLAATAIIATATEAHSDVRPAYDSRPVRIDFTAPPDRVYASHSAAQLFTGRFDHGLLAGKIVLVGVNYEGSSDRHPTPLSVRSLPAGRVWAVEPVYAQHLAGTEIQAYVIDTFMRRIQGRNRIREAATWLLVTIGSLLGAAVVWRCWKRKPRVWAALVLGPSIAFILAAMVLFQTVGWYFPVLRPLAAFLLITGVGHSVAIRRRVVMLSGD